MKLLLKVLLPVLVLVGSVYAAKTIRENRPEPRKRPQFPQVQAVEATTLSLSDYAVVIRRLKSPVPSFLLPMHLLLEVVSPRAMCFYRLMSETTALP